MNGVNDAVMAAAAGTKRESDGDLGPAKFQTPRSDAPSHAGSLLARIPQAPPMPNTNTPQLVDASKLESMFEKFTEKISTDVKSLATMFDLHVQAMAVVHKDHDERLTAHNKQLSDTTERVNNIDSKLEGVQKEIDEMRKSLANPGSSSRGTSAPPAGSRKVDLSNLTAFEHNQEQIEAIKTKLEIVFNSHPFDRANADESIKNLMSKSGYQGSGIFSVLKADPIKQGANQTGTRVVVDFHSIEERDLMRNSLRKRDGNQWSSTIPTVEAYTLDPEFIINRNKPMLSTRTLLASKLGVKKTEIKFDKQGRKLILMRTVLATDGAVVAANGAVLAQQSLATWRVRILGEED